VVAWLDAGQAANHRIDSNYFADRPVGRTSNGYEMIRIGDSATSNTNAGVVVENNLFKSTDGEIEIISIKSNDNIYRYNTITESAGTLTLRHGDRATVEGNFILGNEKDGSGGVRVIGQDHKIFNNYIANVDDRADGAIAFGQRSPMSTHWGDLRSQLHRVQQRT
jgi:Chondroitinase B